MPNYPASLDTQITVYDDGSSITDTARVVATGGALGVNYGFVLGTGPAGAGVRNIPRGGFPQGPSTATAGTLTGAAAATGGQMATGTYRYQVTLQTQFGESAAYTIASDVTVTGPTGSVYLAGLPLAGPTATVANPVIARKVYRTTIAGGVTGSKFLVGIIDDALATACLDMLSDAEVGTQTPPVTDSSGVFGIVVPTCSISGNAVTFTEVALNSATPSASLAPASIAGPYTCQFAVDYSYGSTGGTVYFPANFSGQVVAIETELGATPLPAGKGFSTLKDALAAAVYNNTATGGNNASLQLTHGNVIGWDGVAASSAQPAIYADASDNLVVEAKNNQSLYLQKDTTTGTLDIYNGKVTVSPAGTVTTPANAIPASSLGPQGAGGVFPNQGGGIITTAGINNTWQEVDTIGHNDAIGITTSGGKKIMAIATFLVNTAGVAIQYDLNFSAGTGINSGPTLTGRTYTSAYAANQGQVQVTSSSQLVTLIGLSSTTFPAGTARVSIWGAQNGAASSTITNINIMAWEI
jgi:hypothetical protein